MVIVMDRAIGLFRDTGRDTVKRVVMDRIRVSVSVSVSARDLVRVVVMDRVRDRVRVSVKTYMKGQRQSH